MFKAGGAVFYRILVLVRKEWVQIWRQKMIVFFLLVGMASELVMVGYTTSRPVEHLPLAVIDEDRSADSRALLQMLTNSQTFNITAWPVTDSEAARLIEEGKVVAAIHIAPDFSARLRDPAADAPRVQLLLDGSEPVAVRVAEASAEGAVGTLGRRIAVQTWHAGSGPGAAIEPEVRVWFNESLSESNYEVPSELGFVLLVVTLTIASLGIARERELGTLEQLQVTPLRGSELVVGKALPAVILAYAEFLVLLAVSHFGFGVPIRGSLALLMAIALFYIFVELGWGLMISSVSKNQQQALLIAFSLMMVEIVFSGYATPVENMPAALRVVANFVPIKHWLIILRDILLKGVGVEVFWPELVALALLGLAINALTIRVLRRQGA
jgi:ABC-2 type transport system permease protein